MPDEKAGEGSAKSLIFCKDKIFSYICTNYNEKLTLKMENIMKRFFTFFAVVVLSLMTILPASAQDYSLPQTTYNKRVHIGVGALSVHDIFGILIAGLSSLEFDEGSNATAITPCTNPSFEMLWNNDHWFSYGFSFAFGCASGSVETAEGFVKKRTNVFYPTIGFVAETRYYQNNGFALYGSWGLDATIYAVEQNYFDGSASSSLDAAIYPCLDVYPLCFRSGEKLGIYAEVGWGSRGVANVGAFINF